MDQCKVPWWSILLTHGNFHALNESVFREYYSWRSVAASEKDGYQRVPAEAVLSRAAQRFFTGQRCLDMTAAQALRGLVLAIQAKTFHDDHVHPAFRARTSDCKCGHDRPRVQCNR